MGLAKPSPKSYCRIVSVQMNFHYTPDRGNIFDDLPDQCVKGVQQSEATGQCIANHRVTGLLEVSLLDFSSTNGLDISKRGTYCKPRSFIFCLHTTVGYTAYVYAGRWEWVYGSQSWLLEIFSHFWNYFWKINGLFDSFLRNSLDSGLAIFFYFDLS